MADDQSRGRRRPYGERSPPTHRDDGAPREPQEGPRPKVFRAHPQPQSDAAPSTSRQPANPAASTSGAGANPAASTSRAAANPAASTSRAAAQAGAGSSTSRAAAPAGAAGGAGRRPFIDRYEVVNTRPRDVESKQGHKGKPIRLQANFFKLVTKPQWRIVHYHVDFEPDIDATRVRRGIMSNHANVLGSGYLFDGKQLFTTVKLEKEVTVLKGTSKTGVDYTITMKYVGIISTIESRFLQVLNLILRRAMNGLQLELVGRNLFDPHAKISLREHRMELWPGYETSIRQHENDILLNCEIAHKVMRTETVYDILRRCSSNPQRHQEEFRHSVLGLIVLTDYNNKTYRVNDVEFGQTPRSTFNCKGQDVSFVDYYLKKYNIRIRDQNQPLLISKNKDSAQRTNASEIVILIPELCRATGLTDSMRSNFQLMRSMADYTRMNPERRIERLVTFQQRLQNTPASVKVLNDWNLKLEDRLTEVQGRVIGTEKIVFKQNKQFTDDSADWTRHFRSEQMLTVPKNGLDRWAVIAPERSARELKTLLDSLRRAASGLSFLMGAPREFRIHDDRTASYIRAMDECANFDPKLILCLVPNINEERYSSIKKRGCIDRAIPTQVVTTRSVGNRGLMSIATKIAVQLNCKLGYTPWMVELPLNGLMTIGFDIAKCTRDRSKAYGAMVASMDLPRNSTYYSTVAECSAYDVLSNNLWAMMAKALRQYRHEHGGELPKRIVFYRDGVSSGSLKQLYDYEVKDIVEKLGKEYEGAGLPTPKLAYIVVTKSSNVRFFQGHHNPPPGTVIDNVVTLPERYDFYLVSQKVRQGTVSPTSYNVVYSNIGLDPDKMQILTYKMCHLYYNWSGTIRVPAVCQYAKKLATMVGTNLHAIPQNALEKKFYYL